MADGSASNRSTRTGPQSLALRPRDSSLRHDRHEDAVLDNARGQDSVCGGGVQGVEVDQLRRSTSRGSWPLMIG